ncbi:hypothetical protein K488DRAFT_85592 [Vararia minispora EC-137]|uniref:Uncharacterized protein n=1 Tax=Vararia minispora EC-137 TaxID=1314806 RepID=A0ACB8QM63_9AGAM|nr:hypothetical protein K488DRAFT_85592 [Vararia minispora EC-137]
MEERRKELEVFHGMPINMREIGKDPTLAGAGLSDSTKQLAKFAASWDFEPANTIHMRVLSFLAVGATLVFSEAAAAPLSVVVSPGEVSAWRIGHPAVGMNRIERPQQPSRMGRFCGKMKTSVAHLFAIAGLGPVVPNADVVAMMSAPHAPPHRPAHSASLDGAVPEQMPPIVPLWQKAGFDRLGQDHPAQQERPATDEGAPVARPHGHHHHHNFRPYHRHHGSFLRRVHRALMTLGPWEGRAVAFVLGCGIGVLLRMVWVITVLFCRAVRGTNSAQEEDGVNNQYEEVAFLLPEEIFVSPPEYTDEKADHAPFDAKA